MWYLLTSILMQARIHGTQTQDGLPADTMNELPGILDVADSCSDAGLTLQLCRYAAKSASRGELHYHLLKSELDALLARS